MNSILHIRLSDISDDTRTGDIVSCTVGGASHNAKCIKRHGGLITVKIENLREVKPGTFQRDLFSQVECVMYVNPGGYAESSCMER